MLSLVIVSATPHAGGSAAAGDSYASVAAAGGSPSVGMKSAAQRSAMRSAMEESIDAKTVEPERGQGYDGYIVVANGDMKRAAEADGYAASPSGDFIKVDEPLDALDFTDPSHVVQIIPNNIIYPADAQGYPYSTNDEYWQNGNQWNLYPYETTVAGVSTGYGIGVQALYRRGLNGNGVSVGIFDTGLMYETTSGGKHPDMRKNFTAEHGINFASMVGDPAPSGDPLPSAAYDMGYHGTAVAGFIAAIANNGIGIAGVADSAEIYPYRMFNAAYGSMFTVFYGLEYLLENDELPDVINMSIGTDSDEYISAHLQALFDRAAARGTIVVAAASNSGGGANSLDYLSYPASFDSVISVANTTQSGSLSGSSQENAKVDVAAPGTGVWSTRPGGSYNLYGSGSGTSFSSPLVAGVAAALKQAYPSMDVYAFRELIKKTARKIRIGSSFDYGADGHSASYGYGLLDAEAMLSYLEQENLYRIEYDLGGGRFLKECSPVCYATAGAFASGIALSGASGGGAAPCRDGYLFAGWNVSGSAAVVDTLTAGHMPPDTDTPVELVARWTPDTYLCASDFAIPLANAVEIEDAEYYDGNAGYARGLATLSALAGAQSAPEDPIVRADINSLDYIENTGEGCYLVEFITSKGAVCEVAMAVYGDGREAGFSATAYDSASVGAAPTAGSAVMANGFAVSLSAIATASPAALAGASAYTWQRSGNALSRIKGADVAVEGFSSITQGGIYPVSFRAQAAGVTGAVCTRNVTVIDDVTPEPPEPPTEPPTEPPEPPTEPPTEPTEPPTNPIPEPSPTPSSGSAVNKAKNEKATKIRIPIKRLYITKGSSVLVPVVADGESGKADANVKLEWISDNPEVVSVDQSGRVTAHSGGSAVIRVWSQNGKTASFKATVVKKPSKVKKLKVSGIAGSGKIRVGRTAQLKLTVTPARATVTRIKFRSGKPSVLSVDKAGRITAKKKGRAVITVVVGNKSQKLKITAYGL
jgi:uncharacterized repeat protein (TIGR02543 family)